MDIVLLNASLTCYSWSIIVNFMIWTDLEGRVYGDREVMEEKEEVGEIWGGVGIETGMKE